MELEYGRKYHVKIGTAQEQGIYIGRIRSNKLIYHNSKHSLLTNINGVLECWTFYEFFFDDNFLVLRYPKRKSFKNDTQEEFAKELLSKKGL